MTGGAQLDEDGWPGPIPYTLSPYLCIEFVNSRFEDHTGTGDVYDRLQLPRWRAWFASRAGIRIERPPTPETHRDLLSVRARLRDLLESQALPDPGAISWINRYLAASTPAWQLRRTATGVQLELAWDADWQALIAAVLASYGQLLEDGRIERVRRCANPHCTWLFYDESHNASRRWCDPHRCGNLVGVRAYRERSRARSRSPHAPAAEHQTP